METEHENAVTLSMNEEEEDTVLFTIKWRNKQFLIDVSMEDTVERLKEMICEVTDVLPIRQKLVGLKDNSSGRAVVNETVVKNVVGKKILNGSIRFMMIGTPEAGIHVYDVSKEISDVLNDLDVDYSHSAVDMAKDHTNIRRLQHVIASTEVAIMHPPRPGKKLLVLDLDYTLFDMKSSASNFLELKRPFTDEMLSAAYQHFDIVVWSQTSWRWLEVKLTELGILSHPSYRISFVLDKTSMFSVTSKRRGKTRKHQVKPLDLIWKKFPEFYSQQNTLHIDDLSRNFAMNPRNGLKISPFKDAHRSRHTDRELAFLTRYIELMNAVEDISSIDHNEWKKYLSRNA